MKTSDNRPLSLYRICKILWCFVINITATQTTELLGINRNTVNRYYSLLQQIIYDYQMERFCWRKSNGTMYNILNQRLKKYFK